MGLKSFLKQQGFIQDDADDKPANPATTAPEQKPAAVMPTYFPVTPARSQDASTPVGQGQPEPNFVTPLQQSNFIQTDQPDPTFVKFFEDELTKANLPGPDYFEFRQQLIKTQQKMAAKGMAAPDVVLQAVLMSFDAQGIPAAKLIETAQHYKEVIKQKSDDFIKGAETEKSNQLQKRQSVLQTHDDNVKKLQQQIQQLDLQRKQLDDALIKEKTQADVDKSLGKEAIEKIEKAERLISLAQGHMQATIDADIARLQTV